MGKKVTIYTIAEKLGISSATVYRAINNKPNIKEDTKKLVLQETEKLGFKPNALAQSLNRNPLRFACLLYSNFAEFDEPIIKGVKHTAGELKDFNVHVDFFTCFKGIRESTSRGYTYLKKAYKQIAAGDYNGLLMHGPTDFEEFNLVQAKQIPLVCIVTDIQQPRKLCVRYNGKIAGHIAGELLYWRLGKRGKAAIASNSENTPIHKEILQGFREQMEITPLHVKAVLYNKDDKKLAYQNTNKLLEEHPDIKGIYVTSMNSREVIRSVVEHGLGGKICLITSDVCDYIKRYLEEGIISASIFQSQYQQGCLGLRYLYRYLTENIQLEDTVLIKPEVIFRSNMTLY